MNKGINLFNQIMVNSLIKNKRYLLSRPSYIKAFAGISANIKRQTKVRADNAQKDLIVPPVLIMSVTNDCNLSCKGCYACEQNRSKAGEMDIAKIERVIDEAVELGVAVILIAGGEPLLKKGILDIPQKYKSTLFVMFTNGLLLDSTVINELDTKNNLIPIISIEGSEATTDERRGIGIFNSAMEVMSRLDNADRLFGASITLTSKNYDEVVKSDYLAELASKGCGTVFLIEYVPSDDNDMELCLTDEQKKDLCLLKETSFNEYNMLIVLLPGDEEKFGGCLASGRGFLHISSTGALEACPFAPYSDISVSEKSLKEALLSPLLREIRDNHHLLKESRGGCALKENQEWVEKLLSKSN